MKRRIQNLYSSPHAYSCPPSSVWINLLFANVRLYLYLSVFVRKKGGRQFQSVILEGVTDFLRAGELGEREALALLSPQAPLSFGLCGV